MFTKTKELNRFQFLKEKIFRIKTNLFFLRACKKHHLTPTFMQYKREAHYNKNSERAIHKAKLYWLKLELKQQYSNLMYTELELYTVHQKLANSFSTIEWDEFSKNVHSVCIKKFREQMSTKKKKLLNLRLKQRKINTSKSQVSYIDNFIINKSSIELNKDELNLLNNGLNFAVPHREEPLKQFIVDSEVAISAIHYEDKPTTTSLVKNSLNESRQKYSKKSNVKAIYNTIDSLNKKDVFSMKADKGNAVVVVDKIDYDNFMQKIIDEGPYKCIPCPLNKMNKNVNTMLKEYETIFGLN